jgi:hypothetical protein
VSSFLSEVGFKEKTPKNNYLYILLSPEGEFALEVVNHIIERNSLPYGNKKKRGESTVIK